jgi:hypothetical protein
MPPSTDQLDPGRMDVPPLAGWGHILIVLVIVIAVSAVLLGIAAVVAAREDRTEWQAWLDGRSRDSDSARRQGREQHLAVGHRLARPSDDVSRRWPGSPAAGG